jgi:hypothetical protein
MDPVTDTTPAPAAPILNLRRGTITLEIGGQLRTLKFGMNTLAAFGQLHMDSPADFSEQFTKNPLGALRDMVYCALSVTKGNELPADFDLNTSGDWIDELRADNPDAWPQIQQVMLHSLSLGAPNRATLAAATPASA